MRIPCSVRVLSLFLLTLCPSFAQTLYTEDFDSDHSPNWSSFTSGSDAFVDYYFDYGTDLGIPAAPHSTNGVTRGMRFLCNQSAGVFQGICAFPTDLGFTGNYRLRFDMWLNHVGPLTLGGSGSTQCSSWGVGGTGQTVEWAGACPNVVMFAGTSDGGSTDDYRCYSNSVHLAETSGAYAAGSVAGVRNSANAYYSTFGNEAAPAAQLALYSEQTGNTATGALGFKWHDVVVEKIQNTVTCYIDGKLIATSQTPSSFSTNIFFGQFDINAGSSTSAHDFLTCSIFDNITVEVLDVTSVDVTTDTPTISEGSNGQFLLTRAGGDLSSSLTVTYNVTGTASNGVDYVTIPGSITFDPNETNKTISVQTIDDSIAEFAEIVVLTLTKDSTNYVLGGTSSATITVTDNEAPELTISATQPTAYERTMNDYLTFQISRKGDTSIDINANFSFAGTATNGVNYSSPVTSVNIPSGTVSQTFQVSPINDSDLQPTNLTVVATLVADPSYSIGTSGSATGTIIDDELAPETVLFADDLTSDTSANWTTLFGSNNGIDDKEVTFGFDLLNDPLSSGIPNPPNGSNTVLKLTVNKGEGSAGGAAGVNVYPNGQSFSGDFAMRFDMYLQQNNNTSTTEFATFGINHSGTKTNWNRQSTANVANVNALPKNCDGLWFSVISDASASAPGDYALFTGTNAASAPTIIKTAAATAFSGVFKNPPFTPGIASGVPGNVYGAAIKNWVNVEVKKIGSLVTMSINKTPILTYTNTTSYTNGDVMLGYMDPYDTVGGNGGSVYFSNLRVVNLNTTAQTPVVSGVQSINNGTQIQINFSGAASDDPSSFSVQSAATLSNSRANYATEGGAVITSLGSGSFKAVVPVSSAARFYFIKR